MSLHAIADFLLHIDVHVENITIQYQTTTYFILCLVIFCETGLVVTPFLPGDSLLFAVGAIVAKTGILNIWILIPLLITSAIVGDNANYFVGRFFGHKVLEIQFFKRIIKKKYLDQTHAFYEKHGGKTIIMARFIPIIRTFAPFVAGVGEMKYIRYISFSIVGGITWVVLLTLAGYYFGGIKIVKNNFEWVVLGIIAISVLPVIFQLLKAQLSKTK